MGSTVKAALSEVTRSSRTLGLNYTRAGDLARWSMAIGHPITTQATWSWTPGPCSNSPAAPQREQAGSFTPLPSTILSQHHFSESEFEIVGQNSTLFTTRCDTFVGTMASIVVRGSFLDLPPEIRVNIYRHLFGSVRAKIDAHILYQTNTGETKVWNSVDPGDYSSQLFSTCKTISKEASPVFFDNTIFSMHRAVSLFCYMKPRPSPVLQMYKIRHLEVDLRPEQLQDYPQRLYEMGDQIETANFQTLKSLKLVCHAVEWRYPPWAACNNFKVRVPFRLAQEQVGLIAYAFLQNTNMNWMENKSKNDVRIMFQVSTVMHSVQPNDVRNKLQLMRDTI